MHHTVQGLILREVPYGETAKILTVLTTDLGKLTISARGSRKKNSTLAACTQLLTWSELVIYDLKGRWLLKEGSVLRPFMGLTTALPTMSLACYCAQVVELLAVEGLPNEELLSLLLNTLHILESHQDNHPLPLIKSAFELRTMALSGYEPYLEGCAVCGKPPEHPRFHLREGVLHCALCGKQLQRGVSIPLTQGALDAMRHLCWCNPKKLFSFTLDEPSLQALSRVTEGYLLHQLERGFGTLDYYHRIK